MRRHRFFQRIYVMMLISISSICHANTIVQSQSLLKAIRCPVCESQSILESNAPEAVKIRQEVLAMIEAKHSESDILGHIEQKYGKQLLRTPTYTWDNTMLWAIPHVMLVMVLTEYLRNKKRQTCVKSHVA